MEICAFLGEWWLWESIPWVRQVVFCPSLVHPGSTGDYELHTDASGVSLGACLNQVALTCIFTTKTNLSGRPYRWVLRVHEFDTDIKYRKRRTPGFSRNTRFDPVLSVGVIDVDTGAGDCDHAKNLKPTLAIIYRLHTVCPMSTMVLGCRRC